MYPLTYKTHILTLQDVPELGQSEILSLPRGAMLVRAARCLTSKPLPRELAFRRTAMGWLRRVGGGKQALDQEDRIADSRQGCEPLFSHILVRFP